MKWWVDKNGFSSIKNCNECNGYVENMFSRESQVCIPAKKEYRTKRSLKKHCPLIEAKTKAEAKQKIREIFGL